MHLTRTQQIVVGILTLAPYFLFAILMFQMFTFMSEVLKNNPPIDPGNPFVFMSRLMIPAMLMMLLGTGLLIFYIIHAVRNHTIDSNERLVWILVFIFAGVIGFLVYYFMRIWKSDESVKPMPHQ